MRSTQTIRKPAQWLGAALVGGLLLLGQNVQAQGQCFTGGCATGTGFGGAFSTTSATFQQAAPGTWGGEYNTFNVTAGTIYEWSLCTADGATNPSGDMTMTLKTTGGTNLCYSDDYCGLQPRIQWTASFSGQVRVQINTYPCGTNTNGHTMVWRAANSGPPPPQIGCTNGVPFASLAPTCIGLQQNVSTCTYAGEYNNLTLTAGVAYTIGSSVGTDYITIANSSVVVQQHGVTPQVFTPTVSGTYRAYFHTSAACGTQNSCRTTWVQCGTPPPPGECINTAQYFTQGTFPSQGGSVNAGTCMYPYQRQQWNGAEAGATYTFAINSPASPNYWVTIRQGTFNGPVVANGTEPVSFTAPVAGTYFVNVNTSDACSQTAVFTCMTPNMTRACNTISATAQIVNENCVAGTFNVLVIVPETGCTGGGLECVDINYQINGVNQPTVEGVNFYTITGVSVLDVVTVQVSNGIAACTLDLGEFESPCPIPVTCGVPDIVVNYCYKNNDAKYWIFTASNPNETITLSFVTGSMQEGDVIRAYSGTSNLGTPIPSLTGSFGNLNGANGTSTGANLYIEVDSDGSGSCFDGSSGASSWTFTVGCTAGCVDPIGTAVVDVINCVSSSFSLSIELDDPGDDPDNLVEIQYSYGGNDYVWPESLEGFAFVPVVVTGLPINQVVTITLLHDGDPLCNTLLGSFFIPQSTCFPDDPCTATPLPVGLTCVVTGGTLVGSTQTQIPGIPNPTCASFNANITEDVWFSAVVPPSGVVIAETFPNTLGLPQVGDTGMAMYIGTCGGPMTTQPGWCNDDGGQGLYSLLNISGLTPGDSVWLRVWHYGDQNTGSFGICVSTIPVCTTPNPGATTGPALACANNNFTLGLTNVATGVAGISYQWQFSNVGATGPWTNFGTNSPTQTVNGLPESRWYQCVVTCSFEGAPVASTPLFIGQDAAINCYCTSTATATGDTNCQNVTLGTLNNSSSGCATYTNFTQTVAAPDLVTATAYSASFTKGTCGGNFAAYGEMYIDWNQNGIFEASETMFGGSMPLVGSVVNGTIVIPVGATPGLTGMRVVIREGGTALSTAPCGNYTWGETEDYWVNIIPCTGGIPTVGATNAGPYCVGDDIELFAVTSDATNFSWTGPNGFESTAQNPVISGATLGMAGEYTVYADNGPFSCPAPLASTTVAVNPNPPAPTLTVDDDVLCLGESATITATIDAPSGPVTFESTGGPSTVASSGPLSIYPWNINVSGISPGATVQSVTLNWGTGASFPNKEHTWASDIDILLISPSGVQVKLLSDVGGANDLNGSYTLQDGAPIFPNFGVGGNIPNGTYRPTVESTGTDNFPAPGPGFVGGPNPPTLATFGNGDQNGNWQLFVMDDAGGDGGAIMSWSITVLAPPSVGNFTWSPPNGLNNAVGDQVIATPGQTTTYTVTNTIASTGCTSEASVTITVNPLPVANAGNDAVVYYSNTFNAYACTQLMASGSGGTAPYTYQWVGNMDAGATWTVCPTADETVYTVIVTDANGCTATDEVSVFGVNTSCGNNDGKVLICINGNQACINPNGVEAVLENNPNAVLGPCPKGVGEIGAELQLFPNPNNGNYVTVTLDRVADDVTTIALDIIDLSGKRVHSEMIPTQGNELYTIVTLNGDVAPGMYMVNVTAGSEFYTARLVVQH